MNWFFAHLLFTLIWASLLGAYDLLTLLSGFALGLGLFRLTLNKPSLTYRKHVYGLIRFSGFYLREILTSNLAIAADVVRKTPKVQPGIIALDVRHLGPKAKVIVANLITMTPGTLSLDLSDDDGTVYVHCLYLQDPEGTRAAMQKDYVEAVANFQSPT
jgi:multicomponent Na+:H+ antiporter subunit E